MSAIKTALYCHGSINPDPSGSGAARRFWANIKALESIGYNIVRIQFIHGASSDGDMIVLLPEWKRPNRKDWFGYQYIKWVYPLFRPQAYFFPQFDADTANKFLLLINKFKPDLLFFEHSAPWVAGAQLDLSIPSILSIHDFDDVLKGAKRINYLKRERAKGIRRSFAILREKWGAFCLRRYSFELFRKSNKVLTCSQSDFDALIRMGINVAYVPIPVFQVPDKTNHQQVAHKLEGKNSRKGLIKIVHVGGLSGSHNSKGVSWFLNQCLPIINHDIQEQKFEFHFIGSTDNASEDIMKYKDQPNLVFRGFVEDIEKELTEADFAIVPPGYPTGFRTKIPEAFAFGLPVITGMKDAYGAGLKESDPRIIIADTPKDFAKACVRLINDTGLRQKMGKIALETWPQDYDPKKIILETAEWINTHAD